MFAPARQSKTDADHIFIGAGIWLDDDESRAGLLLIEARCFVEEACPKPKRGLKQNLVVSAACEPTSLGDVE
jgi:hypothetical protein